MTRAGPGRRYSRNVMTSPATTQSLAAGRLSRPAQFDVAIAVVTFAGTLAMLAHGGVVSTVPRSHDLDVIAVVLAACSTVPLIAWRRFPLGVFAVTAAASVVLAGLGYPVALIPGPIAALYLLAANRTRVQRWTWHITAIVVGLFVMRLGATAAAYQAFPAIELLHTGLAWAAAWLAGERTRLRQEQIADLHARALRAERETERERLLAVAEERARIARDLHDSAGHAISVIAVRAGAARLRHHQDPDRSLQALEAVEQLARRTAEEIDQMIGTLREGDRANGLVEAPAGLASLDTLVAQQTATGCEVTVETTGTPRLLSGAVDQAVYRILQEAVTNAARHGIGGARIGVVFRDTAIELTVINPVLANAPTRNGGGHGLIGMRERATLLGGSLDTQRLNGMYRVHARIPYAGQRT